MAYKDFQAAEVLTAQDVDDYLMRQSVIVFASATARSLAIAAPTEGMVTYLEDTDELEIYNGTTWLRAVVTSDDDNIDTTGRVTASQIGAGTSSPSGKLDMYTATAGGNLVPLTMSANNTNGTKIDYTTIGFGIEQGLAGIESGGFAVRTYRNGVASTSAAIFDGATNAQRWRFFTETITRLQIDTNGQVTTPSQVRFLVYTGGYNHPGNWADISTLGGTTNRVVDYNVGSGWSPTTGLFTAPTTGYYLFYAGGWANYNGAGNRYAISFHINAGVGGDWLYISGANTSAVDSPLAMSPVVRYMQAGWYMRTAMFSSVGMQLGTSSHKFYYGGYLLG